MVMKSDLSVDQAALAQSDPLPREHQDPSKWPTRETVERAHALAQSDAEPVAWQVKAKGSKNWYIWQREGLPSDNIDPEFYEASPLYAAPPRPDASAGLIEAAEMAEQCANGSFSKNEAMYLRGFADRLRARAADRSGK